MASNPSSQPGNTPPPKPWERAGTSSGPAPFKPPSSGSTSDVVEASGTAKPGDVTNAQRSTAMNTNTVGRPLPSRPWEQNNGSTYGGYGGMTTNNSGYNSGMYSSYGGYGGGGGAYGGGLYGNNMYNRGYSGMYGGNGMGGGMYGGSMYNNGMASPMGGYGMGMGGPGMGMGGPYGNQDPNNPYGSPPSPPGFWMSFMHVMQGVVNFFGRISVLIDQNTQAFHMFMSALLQLFDRSGVLYGELARFVLRVLVVKTKPRKQPGPGEHPGPDGFPSINGQGQRFIEGPKVPSGSWDNVWGDDGIRGSS